MTSRVQSYVVYAYYYANGEMSDRDSGGTVGERLEQRGIKNDESGAYST